MNFELFTIKKILIWVGFISIVISSVFLFIENYWNRSYLIETSK